MFFVEDLRKVESGTITTAELRKRLARLKALTVDEGWWFRFDLDKTPLGYSVARQVPLADWEDRQPIDRRFASLGPGAEA